jgi:DNA (cytosine-5)-methyltransferase 1
MAVVDFFSGCGGFSLGAHQAGFRVAAAFDIDPVLTYSYRRNFPQTKLLLCDLAQLSGAEIEALVGCRIDGIIGGPPCQGFSSIGNRNPRDGRRQLLWHYFRLVAEIRPPFFVMENVTGLLEKSNADLLESCLGHVRTTYHLMGPLVLDAADSGAATSRRRVFVVGIRKGDASAVAENALVKPPRSNATVQAAISDLRNAREIGRMDEYDRWKISTPGVAHAYARELRSRDGTFTGNRRTRHTYDVLRRFSKLPQGGFDPVGKYPRLRWSGLCPTLRAGTGSDRGSFQSVRPVHPEEDRVITVREAARLQGFPDRHLFHPTIWHSFRMIGNSVSPFMSAHILGGIAAHMPWLQFAEAAE